MKKILTEGQLINIIKEAFEDALKKNIINESIYGNDNFTSTTTMDNFNNNDDEDRERELEVAYKLDEHDELPDMETVGVEFGEMNDDGTDVNHSNNPYYPYLSIYVYHPGRDAFYNLTADVMINGRRESIEWKDMSEKMKCDIEKILGLR